MDVSRKDFLKLAAVGVAAGAARPSAAATARPADRIAPAHRTLIRNADLVTMDPKLGEIAAADVLLDGGKVAAVGKGLQAGGAEVIDATGMILMPGMIDGHRHLWEGMDNGVIAKISRSVNDYTPYKYRTMVAYTPEDAWLAQYASAIQAIDSGVTSLLDYCHIFHTPELAEQAARGIIASGIGGTFCYQISHTPTYRPGDTVKLADADAMRNAAPDDLHWQTVKMLREKVFTGNDGLMRFGLCPRAGLSGVPMPEVAAEYARIRSFQPHIVAMHHSRWGGAPLPPEQFSEVSQLGKAGLLGPDYHISHGVGLTDEELAMCRDNGTMICATTMGEHSYAYPSVHGRARAAGVAAGIGVDGALAFTSDFFQHVRSAFYSLFRSDEGKKIALAYRGEDVLDFATRLGAKAIREGDTTGTITPGKRADLLLLRTDRLSFPTAGLLSERVANYANQEDIDTVWIAGVVRKRGGKLVGIDMPALKRRMNEASARINALGATVKLV